jgi:hypothetical protein
MILGAITCSWKSKDEKGKEYTGKDWASPQDYDSIALTEGGFIGIPRVPLHIQACLMNSDTTYVTIIEPAKGPHEVTYPISRRIAPGDVERFHIMVGASKSSKLRLQFKFYVDKDHIVQSEMFDVDVWNPKNSGWEKYYEDNSALSREKIDREIDRLKKEAQGGKIDYWLLKRKAQLSAIPFLTKKKDGW